MRIALVLGVVGHFVRLFSFAFLPPLALAVYDGESVLQSGQFDVAERFAVAAVACYFVGWLFARWFPKTPFLQRSEALGRDLDKLLETLNSLEESGREARGEAAATREEIRSLRREIERIIEERGPVRQQDREAEGFAPAEMEGPGDRAPEAVEDQAVERGRTRFLGIF